MTKESLLSISPIDGRYKNKIKELENYFSEFALIKTRVEVEIKWLQFLLNTKSFIFLFFDKYPAMWKPIFPSPTNKIL